MAMRIEGLVFAGVATADPDAVARFLADALGVEVEDAGEVQRLVFANGSSLALVPPDYVEPPSDTILGFLVDDVEAATAELSAKGIEPDGELLTGYGFRYRHFRAPDGRRFELLDRMAPDPRRSLLLGILVLDEPWSWVVVLVGATLGARPRRRCSSGGRSGAGPRSAPRRSSAGAQSSPRTACPRDRCASPASSGGRTATRARPRATRSSSARWTA